MEIKEYQGKVRELIEKTDKKTGAKHDAETTIIHLLEELGEVARQLYNEKSGRDKLKKENLAEEISDCIMFLVHLANNYNIDMEKAMEEKLDELRKRFGI